MVTRQQEYPTVLEPPAARIAALAHILHKGVVCIHAYFEQRLQTGAKSQCAAGIVAIFRGMAFQMVGDPQP